MSKPHSKHSVEARVKPKPYYKALVEKIVELQSFTNDIIHLLIHVHTFYLIIRNNNKVLFCEFAYEWNSDSEES